ncbi:hypothetical protein Scep_007467 [Stephania cephalantha]|uniref:Alpha/beta hydrolase fold-3 domain-containing protein n=1 Tax=Stephania cephalantha TaxID=152367 RepID=A0AAP0KCM3_9MAGN
MSKRVELHEEFINGVATYDLTINSKSGITVRVYEPERKSNDDSKFPIVLHFHGGGFCISQYDWAMYYHVYTKFARMARAVDRRIRDKLAEPDRELARSDFNRVFLIGDSSGGNLVHAVVAPAGEVDLSPVRLAGAVPVHPGFVRSVRSESEKRKEFETPFLTVDMVDKFLAMALPRGSTKDHPITCLMGEAAPPLSGMKFPPYMVAVAENDLIKEMRLGLTIWIMKRLTRHVINMS